MKKRHNKSLHLKYIRRLYDEYETLLEMKRKLPDIKLDYPIQKGFVKTYRFRQQYEHHPQSQVFKQSLKLFQNSVYSSSKKFKEKTYVKGRGRISTVIDLVPKGISKDIYNDLSQDLQNMFHFEWRYETTWFGAKHLVENYHPINTFYVEEVTRKHYITHIKQIDPTLESKLSKISHKLWEVYEGDLYKAMNWGNHIDRDNFKQRLLEINTIREMKEDVCSYTE